MLLEIGLHGGRVYLYRRGKPVGFYLDEPEVHLLVAQGIGVKQFMIGDREKSEQKLLQFLLEKVLGDILLKVLRFHTILVEKGLVAAHIKLAVYLKRGVGHDALLDLCFGHLEAEFLGLLAEEFPVDQVLESPVLEIEYFDKIVVPGSLVLPPERFHHVSVFLVIRAPCYDVSVYRGHFMSPTGGEGIPEIKDEDQADNPDQKFNEP
jgi:hypothetical protein